MMTILACDGHGFRLIRKLDKSAIDTEEGFDVAFESPNDRMNKFNTEIKLFDYFYVC